LCICSRAVVSAIYEPPQESTRDSLKLLENDEKQVNPFFPPHFFLLLWSAESPTGGLSLKDMPLTISPKFEDTFFKLF
jgi:hypothetical protein